MTEVRLLNLPLPVSKNALHTPIRCGKWTKLVRSRAARLRSDTIIVHIWKQLGGRLHEPLICRPCSIQWAITFPDNRQRDRANYFEHLSDVLEEARVVENDCLFKHEVSEEMPERKRPGFVDLTIMELP